MDEIVTSRTIRRRAAAQADRVFHEIVMDDSEKDFVYPASSTNSDDAMLFSDETESEHDEQPELVDLTLESSSGSGEDSSEDEDKPDIGEQLRRYALESGTPHCHMNTLLGILQPHFPSLPKDARTLLETRKTYNIDQVAG